MHGFTTNNKAVLLLYIAYFNHFNNYKHIGVATLRGRGLQPPCKNQDTLIEQSVTRINKAHRIIVKQVVYDEFMKQIRTVKHSFNTTETTNYRVQLAVSPSTIIIIIKVNKQVLQKNQKFSTRVGTIVDWKTLLQFISVLFTDLLWSPL